MKQPALFKTCPVCVGTGKSQTYTKPPNDLAEQSEAMPCSFCAGLGSVPVKKK